MSFICFNRATRETEISGDGAANQIVQGCVDHVTKGPLRVTEPGRSSMHIRKSA